MDGWMHKDGQADSKNLVKYSNRSNKFCGKSFKYYFLKQKQKKKNTIKFN